MKALFENWNRFVQEVEDPQRLQRIAKSPSEKAHLLRQQWRKGEFDLERFLTDNDLEFTDFNVQRGAYQPQTVYTSRQALSSNELLRILKDMQVDFTYIQDVDTVQDEYGETDLRINYRFAKHPGNLVEMIPHIEFNEAKFGELVDKLEAS